MKVDVFFLLPRLITLISHTQSQFLLISVAFTHVKFNYSSSGEIFRSTHFENCFVVSHGLDIWNLKCVFNEF